MIRVYTKTRHVDSIHKFLDLINLEHEIFTTKNPPSPEHELEPFDLGVSYSYPRKITKNLLSIPPKGFVNYHAAPLPEYKGWLVYEEAIENKEQSNGLENFGIEEETPDLFDSNNLDNSNNEASELTEETNSSEEDEFEIPAFLRRQKN